MRYLLVAILGFGLVATGVFLPWGEKQVARGECSQIIVEDGSLAFDCSMSSVDALYWGDHITGDLRFWRTIDGEVVSPVQWEREFHDYALSGEKLDGNAGLFWGRPMMLFGTGLATVGLALVGATRNGADGARWAAVGIWLGGGGALIMGAFLGIGGMAIHAGTWAGSTVTNLAPRIGGLLVVVGTFAAGYGVVRTGQIWVLKIRGIEATSPLATILEIEAPEPPDKKVVKAQRPKLLFTRDILIGLVAAAIIGGAAAAPVLQKDMTFYECEQRANEWDCVRFDTRATYQLYGVNFEGRLGTTDWNYDDKTRNFDGPLSRGSFTDYHPGTPALGWAYPIWLGGAIFTGIASLAQPWRSRWGKRTFWINLGFFIAILAFLASAIGILMHQSFNWPGSPAGHLRMQWGLLLAALGVLVWGRVVWRCRPRKVKVTAVKRAKTTSDDTSS